MLERCTSAPDIETLFERTSNGKNLGYVKRVPGLSLIEHARGYVLTPSGYPIEESLSFNNPQAPYPFRIGLPSLKSLARSQFEPRTRTYDTVVSFRHHHETNYYHFLLDVLGALELLDASGHAHNAPLVIGGTVARTRFGSEILNTGGLASRNWILQDNDNIWAENILFLRTYQQNKTRADHLLDLMGVPVPSSHAGDRLYLARPPGCRRSISNGAEVSRLLKKYGFREVVPDDLSIQEQIQLFQHARYVVGVHGAGLTNIIYRRGAPLALLELHAYSFVLDMYDKLCCEYGYYYDRLPCVGEVGSGWGEAALLVDLPQLELKVRELLDHANEEALCAD
jgi:hypothetical protein